MAPPVRYRAIRNCHHRSFFYTAGDPYIPTPEELEKNKVPEHFVKERDFTEDIVADAETEDRNRQVFIKPAKADEPPQ